MFANSERLDKSDACDGAESLLVTQRYLAWHGDWLRSSITEEKKKQLHWYFKMAR